MMWFRDQQAGRKEESNDLMEDGEIEASCEDPRQDGTHVNHPTDFEDQGRSEKLGALVPRSQTTLRKQAKAHHDADPIRRPIRHGCKIASHARWPATRSAEFR